MSADTKENGRIRQYLLGTLDERDSEQIEERLLADADFQEEVSATENDLVYDYLTGTLSEQQKKRFDDYFLSTPERQRKLRFFSTLKKSIEKFPPPLQHTEPARSWQRFLPAFLRGDNSQLKLLFTTVVLLLVFGATAVLVRNWRSTPAGDAVAGLATFMLSPGGTRDAGALTRVQIPQGATTIELQLPLNGDGYPTYQAVLVNASGEEKFKTLITGNEQPSPREPQTSPSNKQRVVSLKVPSAVLTRGDYRLKLGVPGPEGNFEVIETYPFRVLRN